MIISEKLYSKTFMAKKIDDNTFEIVEMYDLSHPQCPIVVIDGRIDVVNQ